MPLAVKLPASGRGWRVADVLCTSGPRDPCYVEQHGAFSIALVTDGKFQYRTVQRSALMTPGSLLGVLAAAQALRDESRVTPGRYMLRTRLRHAAMKLRRSNEAIAAVALDCGFEDLSTFNRQFRRAAGLTPGAFRERRAPLR